MRTSTWRRHGLPLLLVVAFVYVPLGVVLLAVKAAAHDHHASDLVDPSFSPSTSWSHGSLWALGLAGWAWAFAAGAVGALAARPRAALAPMGRLLAGASLLTLVLLLDDLFQLHEPTIPDATGVPQGVVLAIYAALVVTWLVTNRRALPDTDLGVLAITLVFFAIWIGAKGAPGLPARTSVAAGAKLCAIAGWASYVTLAAARVVRARRRGDRLSRRDAVATDPA